jgi:hypothetical protein
MHSIEAVSFVVAFLVEVLHACKIVRDFGRFLKRRVEDG